MLARRSIRVSRSPLGLWSGAAQWLFRTLQFQELLSLEIQRAYFGSWKAGQISYRYPFIRPSFPDASELASDFDQIVRSNRYTNFGPYEARLCSAVQDYVGGGLFATTVANATLGLVLALSHRTTLGGRRRNVLMPSFTFAAAPDAALLVGMQPVFVDIDPETLEMDLECGREYLATHEDEVAAVVLCNPFGIGAESISAWERLAADYGLALIVDSAAGFGSRYPDGSLLGGRGDCEIFSLHATKPFPVGEGGLILSRDPTFITNLRSRQNFGFGPERTVEQAGINAKLAELPCAVGLRQLARLSGRIAHRQYLARAYAEFLAGSDYVIPDGVYRSSVPFMSVLAPSCDDANVAFQNLRARGIEAQRYYNPPLHRHPAFSSLPRGHSLDVTDDVCERILSLPVHDGFTSDDVESICAALATTTVN